MGSVTQSGWWKTVEAKIESDQRSTRKSLWPGLSGRPHQPPPVPVPLRLTAEDGAMSLSATNVDRLYEALHRIRTHEELERQLELFPVCLVSQHSGLAETIIDSIYEQAWEAEEVGKFLLDPRMNPAGSCSFRYIFRRSDPINSDENPGQNLVRKLVNKNIPAEAARLGLLNDKDLIEIFAFALKREKSFFDLWEDSTAFINSIFDALELSGVTRLSGLDENSLCEDMLRLLETTRVVTTKSSIQLRPSHSLTSEEEASPFYSSTPRLVWRLFLNLRKATESSPEALTYTIIHCLGSIDRLTVSRLQYLVDFILTLPRKTVNIAIYQVTVQLESHRDKVERDSTAEEPTWSVTAESDGLLRRVLVAQAGKLRNPKDAPWKAKLDCHEHSAIVAEKMFLKAMDHLPSEKDGQIPISREPEPLELWYAVLGGIGSSSDTPFVLGRIYFNQFVFRGGTAGDLRKRTLLAFWVAMALSVRNNDSIAALLDDRNLGQQIMQRYKDNGWTPGEDFMGTVLTQLYDSPLPAKNKLLHRMCTIGGIPQIKGNYWELLHLYLALENKELSILGENSAYMKIQRHFPEGLQRLCDSFNADLALFEKTARTIIRETKGSVRIVLRLLEHNHALRTELRHAASLFRWNGTRYEESELSHAKALGDYTYTDLVKMINSLAWECARSEMISARQAFRFTWWLLMYLHMHRAPVLPTMLHAVWHAAVHRNPELSYAAIKTIHSINVEYLGEAGAYALLKGQGPSFPERLQASLRPEEAACNGEDAARAMLAGRVDVGEDLAHQQEEDDALVPFKPWTSS